jgi:hypothetical protein
MKILLSTLSSGGIAYSIPIKNDPPTHGPPRRPHQNVQARARRRL